ncbi:ATP-binding protein [Vibrio algarum]|uniref:histidine kinase n=1 Tax=Vibrio algarum TaxID=3020714 RepID=A0ABT4YXM3_9VIBR|nr:ATP-binding protein [Vibrio sp. KJ40-1]MDB1125728.1 ATP-binding protein [Vibrio sp. KJ40-1]
MNLRNKTIAGIAAIEIFLLVILVVSAMSFLSDSNEKQLLQRAHATTTMFSHAIKDAVLTTNLATLDDLVNDIMVLEDVLYVRVKSYGDTLSVGGNIELLEKVEQIDSDLRSVKDGVFDTKINIESNGTIYGSVEIGFATTAISDMLDDAQQAIISIASLEVVLVALFSFVLGTYLTKNLVKLRKAAHTVSKKGPGYQINLKQNDELGEVANAFDTMSRNLEESYKDLKMARNQAEKANESKSLFLASMSHEIRTPMNGVVGLLNSLKQTDLNDEQKKLVNVATDSGLFLLSLINNILDFSRMESNNVTIDRKVFNLLDSTQSVINNIAPIAKDRGLNLNLKSNHLPEHLIGDENRYKQVLLNIIGNALKFTEIGSIEIELFSTKLSDNKVKVSCKVTDTGIGIPAESLNYLFDEFTMADQSFSRHYEGSGLGLAICKKLLDLMDGEITVESTEGVGSCFTFHLPFEYASSSDYLESNSRPDNLHPTCSGCRILVAEDNKANQLVIQNLFKHIGLKIDIANNGIEAVQMAYDNTYDIIFMDISMPDMDGLEASDIIRHSDNNTKSCLPIIACTAHALPGDKDKFINAGMTDYLSKPVNLSSLINTLNKHVAQTDEMVMPSLSPNERLSNDPESMSSKATSPNAELTINESTLMQMVKDTSAEVMPMLIEHYIDEAQKNISIMLEARNNDDFETLKFEAHTLTSSSLALGNTALAKLAREIENLCIENKYQEVKRITENLNSVAQGSLNALHRRKEQGF